MSSQEKKDFGSFAVLATFSAFSLAAVKPSPGGSIRPFCEPVTVTSTPHSSWRKSIEASDDTVSAISSAGCFAASMALRTSATQEVTPEEVSLWTTQTALISWLVSARRRSSMALASTPDRQSDSMNSGLAPNLTAMFFHSVAKWPVSNIRILSPGESTFRSAASQAPVPEEG